MEAEQIYKRIQEIISPIHSHQDQIIAISKWIEDEFKPKVTIGNIDSGLFGKLKIREDGNSGCHSCRYQFSLERDVCNQCMSKNKYAEYYE